jgi:hypothetical protein
MKDKLKIGVLIDSKLIPFWAFEMLEKIYQGQYASIVLFILNNSKKEFPLSHRSIRYPKFILWELYRKFDLKFSKHNLNASELTSITNLPAVDILTIKPEKKSSYEDFNTADIEKIQKYDIDVLIKLGFENLTGDILKVARYGIWNLYHGDKQKRIGGPSGAWEILDNSVESGVTLEMIQNDETDILKLACLCTRTQGNSISENSNNLFLKSIYLIPVKLEELFKKGGNAFIEEVKKQNLHPEYYSNRLYSKPTNSELAFKLITKTLKRIIIKIQKLFYFKQWILYYHFAGKKGRIASFYEFRKILPPKNLEWADPFILKRDGKYYVFIEEVIRKINKGHISVFEIDESGNISSPKKIIEKNYHLSYPFLIEDDGELYLIPESSGNKKIELYKCIEFPYKWKQELILMDNVIAVDTTIFKQNNKYWLFTNIKENKGSSKNDNLYLFYADRLVTNNWTPHPQNPIISDMKRARSAGNIFKYNNRLYRPSQDCSKHYGYGIKISQILTLNEDIYEDAEVSSIYPGWEKKLISTHTLNSTEKLTIIDARIKRR